ncbi:MAG TPA: hypothetical protein VGT24_10025 [Candidatus Acidoferrales bacterium]|nr:hypothetical protein [Candidatus Acidoferrales bacterium]
MSMTTENFGKQLNPRPAAQPQGVPFDGSNDDTTNGFAPDVVVQTDNKVIATPKPGDSSWNHCDTVNAGGTSATPGVVMKPAVMDGGKPRTSGSGKPGVYPNDNINI